jgi:hypothetical protein
MSEEFEIRPDEEDVVHNYIWRQKKKQEELHKPTQAEILAKKINEAFDEIHKNWQD